MSLLNDVEIKLKDTKNFNSIAKEIIYQEFGLYENSTSVINIGDTPGSIQPRKGVPDILFIDKDKRYIFIEITAQQTGLKSKIERVIESAKNEAKHLSPFSIKKLLFICNAKIPVKNLEEYSNQIESITGQKSSFDFWGIDKIAFLISTKYQYMASTYLDININSSGLVNLEDSIKSNIFESTHSYKFLFRENEIESIIKKLVDKQIVIIHGSHGSGKTRLAIEVARRLKTEHKHKDAYIFRTDSIFSLEKIKVFGLDKHTIILDDINRIPSWIDFIDYVKGNKNLYLILTVRDYAFDKIQNDLNYYNMRHLVESYHIQPLTRDQIKEIIRKNTNLVDEEVILELLKLAKDNLRFSIIASEIYNSNGRIPTKIEDLFDSYFNQVNSDLKLFDDLVPLKKFLEYKKVLSLISVLQKVTLELDSPNSTINSLLNLFAISKEDYVEAINYWEKKELINIRLDGKLIEVADQILANYLFYNIVIKDGLLDYKVLIRKLIEKNKRQLVEMFQSLLYIYDYNDEIKTSISDTWGSINKDNEDFNIKMDYIGAFNMLLELPTLSFFKNNLFNIPAKEFSILANFDNKNHYIIALDMIFERFHNSDNEDKKILVEALEKHFWISKNSHLNKYSSQLYLVQKIDELISHDNINISLFEELIGKMFNYMIEWTSLDEPRSLTLNRMTLPFSQKITKIRSLLFDLLEKIFNKNIKASLRIIKHISLFNNGSIDERMIDFDKSIVLEIVNRLDLEELPSTVFSLELLKKFIKFKELKKIGYWKNIKSSKSRIYFMLYLVQNDFEYDFVQNKVNSIFSPIFKNLTVESDFILYLKEYVENELFNTWNLGNILMYFFYHLTSIEYNIREMFNDLIQNYSDISIQPLNLIRYVGESIGFNVVYTLIVDSNLEEKNIWLFQLFTLLRVDQINEEIYGFVIKLFKIKYIDSKPASKWGNERLSNLLHFEEYKAGLILSIFRLIDKEVKKRKIHSFAFIDDFYNYQNGYFIDRQNFDEKRMISIFKDEYDKLYINLFFAALDMGYNHLRANNFLQYLVSKNLNYIYRYYDIVLNSNNHNIDFDIIKSVEDKTAVIHNILVSHVKKSILVLNFSVNDIFRIITVDETVNVLSSLVDDFVDNLDKLNRVFDLVFMSSSEIQYNFYLLLFKKNINIEIVNRLPIFRGPSIWSGSRTTVLFQQKEIADKLLLNIERTTANIDYLSLVEEYISNFPSKLKNEEFFEFKYFLD